MPVMLVSPSLPQDFADNLQIMPVSRLVVDAAYDEHGIQGVNMADGGSMIQYGDDFFKIVISRTMAMICAQRA